MNKGLVIGIGVLAVAGVGGYFWWKSKQNSSASSTDVGGDSGGEKSVSAPESEATIKDATETVLPTIEPLATKKEARQERKQKLIVTGKQIGRAHV